MRPGLSMPRLFRWRMLLESRPIDSMTTIWISWTAQFLSRDASLLPPGGHVRFRFSFLLFTRTMCMVPTLREPPTVSSSTSTSPAGSFSLQRSHAMILAYFRFGTQIGKCISGTAVGFGRLLSCNAAALLFTVHHQRNLTVTMRGCGSALQA